MGTGTKAGEHLLYRGDRVINFRPVFCAALCFAAGIGAAYVWGFSALFWNICGGAAAVAALLYAFLKKKKLLPVLLYAAAFCAVFSLGCLSLSLHMQRYESAPAFAGECLVTGTAAEIAASERTEALTFDDVTVLTEDGGFYDLPFRVKVYVYGGAGLRLGDRVSFRAELETLDLYSYGRMNASSVIENVRYRAFVSADEFVVFENVGAGLFGAVNERIRTLLFANMEEGNAAIAYAMLTGNSDLIDEGVLQNFRYGGIAHIFAVSGLHIGVIYGMLAWICRRLRLHRWVKLPIIAAVLLFYCGVCGFSPSSLRALVMCVMLMLADASGILYDRLTSVSAAFLAVLAVHPVYLFSVGFQLSVTAAAGIILLGGELSHRLRALRLGRLRLPKSVCGGAATAVSAQLFTLPLLIDCFGYTSGLGLLLNIVFVPVISAVYMLLFAITALACLLPALAGTLAFAEFLLRMALIPVMDLEWKTLLICGFSFGGAAALWYLLLFLLSDKVNLKALPKALFAVALAAALTLAMCLRNLPPMASDARLSVHSYYGSDLLLLQSGGETALISGGEPDPAHAERLFLQEGIASLDRVVILAEEKQANAAIPVLAEHARFDTVLLSPQSELVDSFWTVGISRPQGAFSLCGAEAEFIGKEALSLRIGGSRVLIDCSEGGILDSMEGEGAEGPLPQLSCDVYIAPADTGAAQALSPAYEIYFEKTAGKTSVYAAGDLQIAWKDDIISVEGCR